MTLTSFYVSASGSDTGDGSAASPFASLARATLAMEGSATAHTAIVEGTLTMTAPLVLTAADNGFTYTGAPGAALSGAGDASTLIDMVGTRNVTVSGITLENTTTGAGAIVMNGASSNTIAQDAFLNVGTGVEMFGAANGNVVENNTFNGVNAVETTGGAVAIRGGSNNVVTHNDVTNTAGAAINISDRGTTPNRFNEVSFNDIENTGMTAHGGGAIYVLGDSLATTINMNFISGTGANGVGVLLDGPTKMVSVTNNIVTGIGVAGVEIRGGAGDAVQNNVFDLGTGHAAAAVFAGVGAGNVVTQNVYQTESARPASPMFVGSGVATAGNDFWSTVVGSRLNAGAGQKHINPHFGAGYATSGDGVGFVAIDRSVIGVQH